MTADVEMLPCPFCGKSNQDRCPCKWLDDSGANVIRCAWCHGAAPASTWNLRTAPPSAPVGWKLVPVKPTPEMRQAYHDVMEAHEWATFTTSPDDQWNAMLAAAPALTEARNVR